MARTATAACFAVLAVATVCGVARGGTPVVYGYPYAARCPAAGIVDAVDRWKMDECNCTSFVAWALAANGRRTDWFIAGAMDALNWPHVARLAGLHVGASPRVGAVAVWQALSRFGHVAYVTAVHAGNRFDVAEYNLPAPDGVKRFDFDERNGLRPGDGVEFIYVPLRHPA
jgi:surface antigen